MCLLFLKIYSSNQTNKNNSVLGYYNLIKTQMIFFFCGWYIFSIAVSLYNKWMFDLHKGFKFPYPILVTSLHQFFIWGLSYLYLKSKNQLHSQENSLSWLIYFKYIIPTAVASAGDIAFASVSFKYISLTIYTIVKSSSIAFVLIFGCIYKLERFSPELLLVVLFMFGGISLMTYKPYHAVNDHTNSDQLLGFFLVLMSSCLSGIRWVYTQMTFQLNTQDLHSISTIRKPDLVQNIYQLTPFIGASLFLAALLFENPFPKISQSNLVVWEGHTFIVGIIRGLILLLFPGLCVFIMTICEFGILQTAPVLTLSIAGITKELLTVLIGMLFFKETLGFYNWIGMCIVMLDVCFYNHYRYMKEKDLVKKDFPIYVDTEDSCELHDISEHDPQILKS